MRYIVFLLLGSFRIWAAAPPVAVVHSSKSLDSLTQRLAAGKSRFGSKDFGRYPNHYTLLAERNSTGSSELHEHEADICFVISGEATLVSGGKIVKPHTRKAGEIRGASIEGGERQHVATGDVIHIPAGVPHQFLVSNGKPFSYFVVKVTGQ